MTGPQADLLVQVLPDGAEMRFQPGQQVLIGRDTDVQVLVAHPRASRHHALLTSSTSPGSTPARSKTARMTGATMLGASRLLNEPRYDLVNPVRAVDTITASFIVVLLSRKCAQACVS